MSLRARGHGGIEMWTKAARLATGFRDGVSFPSSLKSRRLRCALEKNFDALFGGHVRVPGSENARSGGETVCSCGVCRNQPIYNSAALRRVTPPLSNLNHHLSLPPPGLPSVHASDTSPFSPKHICVAFGFRQILCLSSVVWRLLSGLLRTGRR